MNDNVRTVAAVAISMSILLGYQYFFPSKQEVTPKSTTTQTQNAPLGQANQTGQSQAAPAAQPIAPAPILPLDREQALTKSERITMENDMVKGSISLTGGMLDDLVLKQYKETPEKNSPDIKLLSPMNTKDGYVVEGQWRSNKDVPLPNAQSQWKVKQVSDKKEGNNASYTLEWDNGKGLHFERTISLDNQYLFTITETVVNNGTEEVQLAPGALIQKEYADPSSSTVHEGGIGYFNSKLFESKYDKSEQSQANSGWFGVTDRFWLVAVIPTQNQNFFMEFTPLKEATKSVPGHYKCAFNATTFSVQPNGTYTYTYQVFAGPKVIRLLDSYESKLKFDHFDLAVDFGWFYFLTKPLFFVLEYLHQLIGNLGIAIIIITILFKILTLPLTARSMSSMAKMRQLQPLMEQLKKRYANDPVKMAHEQRALFKKHGINPMGGCLPMLLQIPIFFCLYKVLLISIEMRHAPFFGWIKDLSAQDPTNIFTLFGLIPWNPPSFMQLGLWPLILGITMLIQQRMTPQTAMDPAQARMMYIMPLVFTFIFANFPAGLVIYWTVSNILSIGQQWWTNRN